MLICIFGKDFAECRRPAELLAREANIGIVNITMILHSPVCAGLMGHKVFDALASSGIFRKFSAELASK
jgi:hypothetical protein